MVWVDGGIFQLDTYKQTFRPAMLTLHTAKRSDGWKQFEPRHKKTCLRGFLPGKTQTGLLSYRDAIECSNVGFSNYLDSEQQRC